MFDKKFFDKNIEPRCEYCSGGYRSSDGNNVLCKRKGIVDNGFHCRHFEYDPLLRIPRPKAPVLPEFDPEDFKI